MAHLFPGGWFEFLAYVCWAGAAWRLAAAEPARLPWKWLATAALGLGAAAACTATGTAPDAALSWTSLGLSLLASLALVEFGRRGLGAAQRPWPGRWIYLPLGVLACAGLLDPTLAGWQRSCRYAFGLPGGLLTAWAMWHAARDASLAARRLLCATALLMLLAVPAFAECLAGAGLAGSALMLQTLGALAAMAGLWFYRALETAPEGGTRWGRQALVPAAAAAVVLGGVLWDGGQRGANNPATVAVDVDGAAAATAAEPGSGGAGAAQGSVGGKVKLALKAKPGPWQNVADRRLRAGLPILFSTLAGVALLIALGVLANRYSQQPVVARGRR